MNNKKTGYLTYCMVTFFSSGSTPIAGLKKINKMEHDGNGGVMLDWLTAFFLVFNSPVGSSKTKLSHNSPQSY